MNIKAPDDVYRLTLRVLTDDVPAAVRMRRALKCLLRSFRLRCLDIQRVDAPDTKLGNAIRRVEK
jgi:hypothetical protein